MEAFDLEVRRHIYFGIVANGRPPSVAETAEAFDRQLPEVEASYRGLHDAHAIVLNPDSVDIRFANPFCFVSTPHRVSAGGRRWTGTCAWDALGIPAALHSDGEIDSECACCGERARLRVESGELAEGADLLVHILVPARRWWDDIVFT